MDKKQTFLANVPGSTFRVDLSHVPAQITLAEGTPKMAVYNPHLLSYKLCRVFDAGLSDVDAFARECDLSPQLIERLARTEGDVDVQIKRRIERALSYYYRRHPELHRDASPGSKRGVREVQHRARDWRGFELRDSTGACVMYVEWPRKRATEERIAGLWKWLDKEDPQPQLRVI